MLADIRRPQRDKVVLQGFAGQHAVSDTIPGIQMNVAGLEIAGLEHIAGLGIQAKREHRLVGRCEKLAQAS